MQGMVLDNIQLRYETAMMDSVATKVWGDGVLLFLFLAVGTFLREKRAMQDLNRHCQWRVWCQ